MLYKKSSILKKFYGALRGALNDISHAKDELLFTEDTLLEHCLPEYKKFLPTVRVEGADEIKLLIEKIENEFPRLIEEYFDELYADEEDDEPNIPYQQQNLVDSKSKKLIIKTYDKPVDVGRITPGKKKDKW